MTDQILKPSEVSPDISVFDRFAQVAATISGRALFFGCCVLMVVIWLPTFFLFNNGDTWQLVINTITTVITFLMVALLQNVQARNDQAIHHKLNAIADGLADVLDHMDIDSQDALELREAVGLEFRESSTNNKK